MRTKLTEIERKAMVDALVAGEGPSKIARCLGVSRQYVSRLKSELRKPAPAQFDLATKREQLRHKGFDAVTAGLACQKDQYKRANIGAIVLKGLGEFQGKGASVSFQQIINSVPEELREQYILTPRENDVLKVGDIDEDRMITTPSLDEED